MITTQLTFTEKLSYKDELVGINIAVILSYGENDIFVAAKVDTGAAVCLFSREAGVELGIDVEQGVPLTLDSLGGPVEAFGHEVILQTEELIFQSVVYFAKYPELPRNILGRQGWLRNLKLAVIDYDNVLYLSAYDA
jgi:hypothetical protein